MSEPSKAGKLLTRNYICILINVVVMNIGFNMLTTVMTPYTVSLGYSLTLAGIVTGIMSITAMLIRPVTGVISDVFPPRRLLASFTMGTALVLIGYACCSDYHLLLVLRVLHGILFSVTTTVTMAVAGAAIPSDRISEGMGYYGVAQAVAACIGPNLGLTISEKYGYQMTFWSAAVMTFAAAGISLLLRPERARNIVHERPKLSDLFVAETLPFLLICFVIGAIGGLEGSFLSLYGKTLGINNVGWYFTVCAVALICSKFILGKVADRCSFSKVLTVAMGFIMIALLLLAGLNAAYSVPILLVAAVSRSVGIGLIQPAVQAMCLKSVPENRRGAASAAYMLEMDLGIGLAPIIGARLQSAFSYRGIYLGYLLPLILSVAVYFIYNAFRRRK